MSDITIEVVHKEKQPFDYLEHHERDPRILRNSGLAARKLLTISHATYLKCRSLRCLPSLECNINP